MGKPRVKPHKDPAFPVSQPGAFPVSQPGAFPVSKPGAFPVSKPHPSAPDEWSTFTGGSNTSSVVEALLRKEHNHAWPGPHITDLSNGGSTITSGGGAADKLLFQIQNQASLPVGIATPVAVGQEELNEAPMMEITKAEGKQESISTPFCMGESLACDPADTRKADNLASGPTQTAICATASTTLQKDQSCDMSYAG